MHKQLLTLVLHFVYLRNIGSDVVCKDTLYIEPNSHKFWACTFFGYCCFSQWLCPVLCGNELLCVFFDYSQCNLLGSKKSEGGISRLKAPCCVTIFTLLSWHHHYRLVFIGRRRVGWARSGKLIIYPHLFHSYSHSCEQVITCVYKEI